MISIKALHLLLIVCIFSSASLAENSSTNLLMKRVLNKGEKRDTKTKTPKAYKASRNTKERKLPKAKKESKVPKAKKESKGPKTKKESKVPKANKESKGPKKKGKGTRSPATKKGKKGGKMKTLLSAAPTFMKTLDTCTAPILGVQGTCPNGYRCDGSNCGFTGPALPTDPCSCFLLCNTDSDCLSTFGPDYGCFDIDFGVKYCNLKCTTDSDCPATFTCGFAPSVGNCF